MNVFTAEIAEGAEEFINFDFLGRLGGETQLKFALVARLRRRFKSVLVNAFLWARQLYWRWRSPLILDVRAIIFHQDRVLLVRHTYGDPRSWTLPGGRVERKETLIRALQREIKEELNANTQIERLHGVYYNFKHGASSHIAVFIASLTDPTTLKPSWEIAAFDFFSLDTLPKFASPATRRRLKEYMNSTDRAEYGRW